MKKNGFTFFVFIALTLILLSASFFLLKFSQHGFHLNASAKENFILLNAAEQALLTIEEQIPSQCIISHEPNSKKIFPCHGVSHAIPFDYKIEQIIPGSSFEKNDSDQKFYLITLQLHTKGEPLMVVAEETTLKDDATGFSKLKRLNLNIY